MQKHFPVYVLAIKILDSESLLCSETSVKCTFYPSSILHQLYPNTHLIRPHLVRFIDPTSSDARRCLYFHSTGCTSIRRCDLNREYLLTESFRETCEENSSQGKPNQTPFRNRTLLRRILVSQNKLWNGGVLESGQWGNLKPDNRNKSFRTRRFKDTPPICKTKLSRWLNSSSRLTSGLRKLKFIRLVYLVFSFVFLRVFVSLEFPCALFIVNKCLTAGTFTTLK